MCILVSMAQACSLLDLAAPEVLVPHEVPHEGASDKSHTHGGVEKEEDKFDTHNPDKLAVD